MTHWTNTRLNLRYHWKAVLGWTLAAVLLSASLALAQLGIPTQGGTHSGIGVISGWKCEANGDLTVVFNNDGKHIPLLYGSERPDVRANGQCLANDHDNVGFVAIWNWGEMADGRHTAVVYDDGVEFDRTTFQVVTTGEGFLRGAEGECTIADFPAPNEWSRFVWTQSTQHLELVEVQSGTPPGPTCEPETVIETEIVYQPQTIDGECYFIGAVNACRAGVWGPSTTTSSVFVYWECQGLNGGRTVSCFTDKPEPEPINGQCHTVAHACRSGAYGAATSSNAYVVAWKCQGLYGGTTASCQANNALTPRCGSVADTCAEGWYQNADDPPGYSAWNCVGYAGMISRRPSVRS